MKRIVLVAVVAMLALTSCKKESVETVLNEGVIETNNSFVKEVSVFDQTGKFSVDYKIEANTQNLLDQTVFAFLESEIEIISLPKNSNSNLNETKKEDDLEEQFYNDKIVESKIFITEIKRNLGNEKAYRININIKEDLIQTKQVAFPVYTSVTITTGPVTCLWIRNVGGQDLFMLNSYYTGSQYLVSPAFSGIVSLGQFRYNTAGGYSKKRSMILATNGNFPGHFYMGTY